MSKFLPYIDVARLLGRVPVRRQIAPPEVVGLGRCTGGHVCVVWRGVVATCAVFGRHRVRGAGREETVVCVCCLVGMGVPVFGWHGVPEESTCAIGNGVGRGREQNGKDRNGEEAAGRRVPEGFG